MPLDIDGHVDNREAGIAAVRAAAEVVRQVQAGARAVPLVEEALGRRQGLPMVLVIAGDIGASRLEPELRRFTTDPDPQVAKAALDGLRILAAQHTSVPQPNG